MQQKLNLTGGLVEELCLLYTEGTDPLNENRTLYLTFKAIIDLKQEGNYKALDWYLCFDQKKRIIKSASLYFPELYFPEDVRGIIQRWTPPKNQFQDSIIAEILAGKHHGCNFYTETVPQGKNNIIKGTILSFFYDFEGKHREHTFKNRIA